MATALKRLAGPVALGTSAATLYTAPGGGSAEVRDIHVCNETGTTRTFRLSIGADGAGTRIYYDCEVPPGRPFQRTGNFHLAAGETLQGMASAGSALTITIGGIETS